jgi:enoyl-CoA hydratase/carnithine racemase
MRARTFDEYHDQYPHIRMERSEEGILLMQFHDDGGEFTWGFENHHEVAFSWRDVGADEENKLIIITGTGDAFLRRETFKGDRDLGTPRGRAINWIESISHGHRLEMDLLEIEQPMIAAINGPCVIHAEIPLLCDVVLAAPHTVIADHVHFDYGFVPGDGVQTVFPALMGLNRARYFMLTGQELTAPELLDLGLINEIVPQDELLDRAYVLARKILETLPTTVRLFRPTLLQDMKEKMVKSVRSGLMAEGLAQVVDFPEGYVRSPRVPSDPPES